MTRQAVTKHLRVLARAGVTSSSHIGRETVWQLNPAKLLSAGDNLQRISAEWDVALARLQKFVNAQRSPSLPALFSPSSAQMPRMDGRFGE